MLKLRDRHEDVTGLSAEPTRARPVLLATLSVRVDPSAERMAIDSARVRRVNTRSADAGSDHGRERALSAL